MTDNDIIQIRLDLDGDLKNRFNKIKKDIGIENNTDVVRFMITECSKKLKESIEKEA